LPSTGASVLKLIQRGLAWYGYQRFQEKRDTSVIVIFISYVEIRVTDLERSVKFYREMLGMKVVKESNFPKTGGGK
jgi:Glyoxalase/Bleomycin resistance protein/Dioxygenase superfamily